MVISGVCLTILFLILSIRNLRILYLLDTYSLYYVLDSDSEQVLERNTYLFVILTMVGIVMIIFGLYSRKHRKLLNSMNNLENKNYCSYCKINVKQGLKSCPMCGRELKSSENLIEKGEENGKNND